MRRLLRPALLTALLVPAALVASAPTDARARPASAATARLAKLSGDVHDADGYVYDARDDTGRTMDTAEITQAPDGTYLAVYHTALGDGRYHAAVATSPDLRTWTRRHDFGPGSSQPTLAADGAGGFVLAYEKDPDNHIAVRGFPGLDALLAGRAQRAFDAPLTLSRCSEGTPDITAVHGGTVELTGHYRANCGLDRQLRAVLRNFTSWRARPDQRLDRALLAWGTGGNIGDRAQLRLGGGRLVLIEGQHRKGDFGSWRTYAYDPATGRADRLTVRTHGGSEAFANPSAAVLRDPRGHPALLVSLFVPQEGSAPGEAGQLLYWRDL